MIIVTTSAGELRRIAETTPSGMPMRIASVSAISVSSTVSGRRSSRIWVTGRPYLVDVPKSPWAISPR